MENIIKKLEEDYKNYLDDYVENVISRAECECKTVEEAKDILTECPTNGDREETAREAWYLQGIKDCIRATKDFISLQKK